MADRKIKIALIGVGNVSSVLAQACQTNKDVSGVWHKTVGGYSVHDIEIVSAFDIDRNKVGLDLSDAIFTPPNVSPKFVNKVPRMDVEVRPGLTNNDSKSTDQYSTSPVTSKSIVEDLRHSRATIALNLISSGLDKTSIAYADQCLKAGLSFVNAAPAIVATNTSIRKRFQKAGKVVVGDDLMSQFGGTAFHKGILDFINSRGIRIDKSYQLDVGGGAETLNTISEDVKLAKREIKTESIAAEVPYKFETVAGTTDYVDYMGNNRTSYFWLSGRGFFDASVKVDVYLRTNDGANAANVLFDVIRGVSASLRRKQFGAPKEICDYGFKKLQKPVLLHDAHREFFKKYVK